MEPLADEASQMELLTAESFKVEPLAAETCKMVLVAMGTSKTEHLAENGAWPSLQNGPLAGKTSKVPLAAETFEMDPIVCCGNLRIEPWPSKYLKWNSWPQER